MRRPLLAVSAVLVAATAAAQDDLRQALGDATADRWIYDDFDKARQEARASKRPILALLRCVP